MTHRLSVVAARAVAWPGVAVVLALGITEAGAADPAFCRQYARTALIQVREALASPRCGASLQGTRWSVEFSVQYEWCLEASAAGAGAERDARTRYLKHCPEE